MGHSRHFLGGKEPNEERSLEAGQCEEITVKVGLGHTEDCSHHENNGVILKRFEQRDVTLITL